MNSSVTTSVILTPPVKNKKIMGPLIKCFLKYRPLYCTAFLFILFTPFSTALCNICAAIFFIFLIAGLFKLAGTAKTDLFKRYLSPKNLMHFLFSNHFYAGFSIISGLIFIVFVLSGLFSIKGVSGVFKIYKFFLLPFLFCLAARLIILKKRKTPYSAFSLIVFPLFLSAILSWAGFIKQLKYLLFFENKNLISGVALICFAAFSINILKNISKKDSDKSYLTILLINTLGAFISGMIILSSGTLSAIVSLAAFLLLLTAYKNKIPALIMLILLISVFILSPRARQKASLIGQKKTSTFRILTWAHSLKKIKSRPLLGHGPGTSEKALCRIIWPKEAILSEKPVHSHNIFLQILLETGILGLAVISALLVIIFKNTCFYGKILIITILINNQFTFFFIDSSYTCAVTGIIMLNMKNSIPGQ